MTVHAGGAQANSVKQHAEQVSYDDGKGLSSSMMAAPAVPQS
jgi:hypothetical protein